MFYAVYETATGRLRSTGTVLADPLPEGLAAKEYPDGRPDGFSWNPETLDFDVPIPKRPRRVSAVEFMQLFTVQERIAIRGAGDPVLDDFLDMVRVAGSISLDHPMVVQGLAYLAQAGILTQARADEIGGA